MPVAVEIQPDETSPTPLKDHQRPGVVPAPQFADFIAVLIDHAEVVFLLRLGRRAETHFDVQILLWARVGGRRGAVSDVAQPGRLDDAPGGRIARQAIGLGRRTNHGQQQDCRQHWRPKFRCFSSVGLLYKMVAQGRRRPGADSASGIAPARRPSPLPAFSVAGIDYFDKNGLLRRDRNRPTGGRKTRPPPQMASGP